MRTFPTNSMRCGSATEMGITVIVLDRTSPQFRDVRAGLFPEDWGGDSKDAGEFGERG